MYAETSEKWTNFFPGHENFKSNCRRLILCQVGALKFLKRGQQRICWAVAGALFILMRSHVLSLFDTHIRPIFFLTRSHAHTFTFSLFTQLTHSLSVFLSTRTSTFSLTHMRWLFLTPMGRLLVAIRFHALEPWRKHFFWATRSQNGLIQHHGKLNLKGL